MDNGGKKETFDVKAIEEDDDFDKLQVEDWGPEAEDPRNAGLWEKDWDDDKLDDGFAKDLRAHVQ